jgi:hypothetical protein
VEFCFRVVHRISSEGLGAHSGKGEQDQQESEALHVGISV